MPKVETFQHPEIGHALRYLRTRRGLSQVKLAERVTERGHKVTSVWLSRIENLDVSQPPVPYPSRVLLDRILGALGCDISDLERVLSERPWTRVTEGSEWAEDPAGATSVQAATAPVRRRPRAPAPAAQALCAFTAPMVPPGPSAAEMTAEAGELVTLYARLSRADQLMLLADARERAAGRRAKE